MTNEKPKVEGFGAEELAEERARHRENPNSYSIANGPDIHLCVGCGSIWPCPTARLLATIEARDEWWRKRWWRKRGHNDGEGGCFYADHVCPASDRIREAFSAYRQTMESAQAAQQVALEEQGKELALLKQAINSCVADEDCLPSCDSYGHAEECKVWNFPHHFASLKKENERLKESLNRIVAGDAAEIQSLRQQLQQQQDQNESLTRLGRNYERIFSDLSLYLDEIKAPKELIAYEPEEPPTLSLLERVRAVVELQKRAHQAAEIKALREKVRGLELECHKAQSKSLNLNAELKAANRHVEIVNQQIEQVRDRYFSLRAALTEAAQTFEEYGRIHREKAAADSPGWGDHGDVYQEKVRATLARRAKAEVNEAHAQRCRQALGTEAGDANPWRGDWERLARRVEEYRKALHEILAVPFPADCLDLEVNRSVDRVAEIARAAIKGPEPSPKLTAEEREGEK